MILCRLLPPPPPPPPPPPLPPRPRRRRRRRRRRPSHPLENAHLNLQPMQTLPLVRPSGDP